MKRKIYPNLLKNLNMIITNITHLFNAMAPRFSVPRDGEWALKTDTANYMYEKTQF